MFVFEKFYLKIYVIIYNGEKLKKVCKEMGKLKKKILRILIDWLFNLDYFISKSEINGIFFYVKFF